MSKLHMMAGAVASTPEPGSDWISAYVVLSAGAKSRVFKLSGKTSAPEIDELPAATTLDLKRFQDEMKNDLFGMGPAKVADAVWVCEVVRAHIAKSESR
jgi:hypothetical protein